jgi:phenylacetate-CoA ligase
VDTLLDRFPLITSDGEALLKKLEEHAHAPRWTHPGVDRLSASALARTAAFAAEVETQPPTWQPGVPPDWLSGFVAHCYRSVPLYRRRGSAPESFTAIPTVSRADLAREPWSFVPDEVRVDGVTVYNTSGTTGHPLSILTDADTLALYLPLMRAALARHGVTLEGGAGRVAVMVAAFQQRTYTYASVSAVLGQAGVVKVNLNPAEWRAATDRARFIAACEPEVISGNPISLAELLTLPLAHRPKALLSTAMTLTAGLRAQLETRFGCRVVDVYSMNESGPIAARLLDEGRLLQPRLYVEIVAEAGEVCAPGVRGEVTLTGGFNSYVPLLRYRTNDFARMEWRAGRPTLVELEGRTPVIFRAADGRVVNNIDVSLALRHLPLSQFALHQAANDALTLRVRDTTVSERELREVLLGLFGTGARLTIAPLTVEPGQKLRQYTRDKRK